MLGVRSGAAASELPDTENWELDAQTESSISDSPFRYKIPHDKSTHLCLAAGDRHKNVVMWMDHRAEEQATRITNTGHGVLKRVGGIMSPELQPPKLLWLKEVRGEPGHGSSALLCVLYFHSLY